MGPAVGKKAMRRDDGLRQGRLARLRRWLGFDRNPVRRGSDRLQAAVRVGLLTVFLTCAPVAGFYVGHGVYVSGLRTAHAQAASLRRVPATVTGSRPLAAGGGPLSALVSVRWAVPGGTFRTGHIVATQVEAAGTTTMVWIDGDGRLAEGPELGRELTMDAVVVGTIAGLGLGLLLAVMDRAVSVLLGRRRLASWEDAWSAAEARWTGRH